MNSTGDESACTDEVKVYKDEGEEEEQKKSSENLTEDKVGLVFEGEGHTPFDFSFIEPANVCPSLFKVPFSATPVAPHLQGKRPGDNLSAYALHPAAVGLGSSPLAATDLSAAYRKVTASLERQDQVNRSSRVCGLLSPGSMGVIHPFGGLMPPSNFYDVALQQQQQRLQMNQQQHQRPSSVSAPSDNSSVSRSTTASSASGNSSLRLHDASPPTSVLHSELVKAAILAGNCDYTVCY
ncbi:hypothetical protein AAHC03_022982 [Spirometra sp. Aus1]